MDDKRIEDLLRDTLRATPPEGMRCRTLKLARQELDKRQRWHHVVGIGHWRLAWVALSVAIVLFTNIAENMREDRTTAMLGKGSHSIDSPVRCGSSLGSTRDIERLLASTQDDSRQRRNSKGGNSL